MGWKSDGVTDNDAIHDNVAGEIAAVTAKGTPTTSDLLLIEDAAASNAKKRITIGDLPSSGGGGGDHPWFTYRAAELEPLAIEEIQQGTFAYAVGSSETKLMSASFATDIGGSGRLDARDPVEAIPLRGVTVNGLSANATAAFIDPTLPTYADARDTYYDRLQEIYETQTKYIGIDGGTTTKPFLVGPYGNIVTAVGWHDLTWAILMEPGRGGGFNVADEIGDAAGDDMRRGRRLLLAVSKNIVNGFKTGTAGGPNSPKAGLSYIICPADWGAVTDGNTYDFRDDFLGASLDTATEWTRAESTSGNVEIDTDFAWCKLIGDGTWGNNGMFSQTTKARASGVVFECDVYIDQTLPTSNGAGLIVGFHDGAGQSFTDFAHGLGFFGGSPQRLQVYENGTSRGTVGANPGYSPGSSYRVRITLGAAGAATYEIQGPEHSPIGGSTWTDVTPGTTSSATDPVAIGAAIQPSGYTHYVGDMKLYT